MARAIHWQVPFVSYEGTSYNINIYEDDYTGSIVTLTGAATPFETQEDDSDDLFEPIRTTTGYIHIICDSESLADAIFPTDALSRYVELVSNGTVKWAGYIKAESYGVDWGGFPVTLDLPVVSPLEAISEESYQDRGIRSTVGQVIYNIFHSMAKYDPSTVYFARVNGETSGCVALSSTFSDNFFIDYDDEDNDAYFSGDDVALPKDGCKVRDVIEQICRCFGVTYHESGKNLYFTAQDSMSMGYAAVFFSTLINSSISTATISGSSIIMPDTITADNTKEHISGYSAIQVSGDIEKPFDALGIDVADCPIVDGSIKYLAGEDDDDKYYAFYTMRNGTSRLTPTTTTDILGTNANAGEVTLSGSNVISLYNESADDVGYKPRDYDDFEDYVVIAFPKTVSGYQQVLTMQSKIKLSGKDFIDSGIVFNFSAKATDDVNQFSFNKNPCQKLYAVIQWGDLYYMDRDTQGNTGWATTVNYNEILVRGDNYSDEAVGYAHNPWEEEVGYTAIPSTKGFKIDIPDSIADSLDGYIFITLYAKSNTSANCEEMLMYDFSLKPIEYKQRSFSDNKDHYKVDYRQALSIGNNSLYTYEKDLFTLGSGNRYSRSVIGSAGSFEQSILGRLATWYDRTIEKLVVTVRNVSIRPFDHIKYNNKNYAVESSTIDWRDDSNTLTLHQLP